MAAMSDSWLREEIIKRFPYPTATAFRSYEAKQQNDRLDYLLYAAESLVQLVGSIVLIEASEELKQRPGATELTKSLDEMELRTASLGLWQRCLVQLLPKLSSPSVPELRELGGGGSRWKDFCQALESLTSERNGLSHPWRRISHQTAQKLLPLIEDYFLVIADSLKFLSSYRLLAVESHEELGVGEHVLRLRPLVGHLHDGPHLELRLETSFNDGDIVLIGVAKPTATALLLEPLYFADKDYLENFQKSIYAFHRQVGRDYIYYGAGDPDHTMSRPAEQKYEKLIAELRDPGGRSRRRPISLSRDGWQRLLAAGNTPNRTPSAAEQSGPRRAPPRSGERARTPLRPEGAAAPPPPSRPPPEAGDDHAEDTSPPLGDSRGRVIPVGVSRPEPQQRVRLRPWVAVFLLVLAGSGAALYSQPALMDRLARALRGSGPHGRVEAERADNTAGGASSSDGGRTDAAAAAASSPLPAPRPEVPWSARISGTQASLFGVWGGPGGLRVAVGDRGTILLSRDSGVSWHARTVPGWSPRLLYAVTGSAAGVLFAVGIHGTILRSSDGGETWVSKPAQSTEILMGAWTDDGRTVFVCGDHGTLLRSVDAGGTWEAVSSASGSLLRGIWGRSQTDLWATGWDGIVLHSEDGQHFRRQKVQTDAWLWDGYTDSKGGVFVVGKKGRIVRSLNRGESWRPVVTDEPSALTSIWGNDREDLWIAGQAGIFHSVDRGATWQRDSSGELRHSRTKLNHLWGNSEGELMAVGDAGTILYSYRKP